MVAYIGQIIEPANGLDRIGPEIASKFLRRVDTSVRCQDRAGTGFTSTITGNLPAILWTTATGFGFGQNAPTAVQSIDITTYSGRYVTFLVVGASSGVVYDPSRMYVAKVSNWLQIACPSGGRQVVPLDVWDTHASHYAGYEFWGPNAIEVSGTKLVTVSADTDIQTQVINWANDSLEGFSFPNGAKPVVVPGSYDPGWDVTVDGTTVDNVGCTLKVGRRVLLTNPESGVDPVTFPINASTHIGADTIVSFPQAYQPGVTPIIELQVDDFRFEARVYLVSYDGTGHATSFQYELFYKPNAYGGTTDPSLTGIDKDDTTMLGILAAPVTAAATTDPTTTGGAGLTGIVHDPGTGVFTGAQDTNHHHTTPIPNADYTTGTHNLDSGDQSVPHKHGLASPGSDHHHVVGPHTHLVDDHHHDIVDPEHTHTFSSDTPLTSGAVNLNVSWISFGARSSPVVNVTVSFIARG